MSTLRYTLFVLFGLNIWFGIYNATRPNMTLLNVLGGPLNAVAVIVVYLTLWGKPWA